MAGLSPKKSLGQNFLFDLNLTKKIARSVPDLEKSIVLEVGPGPGGLTRALLESGAKKVIAVEKDKAAALVLERIQAAANGRLEIIYGDALELSFQNEPKGFVTPARSASVKDARPGAHCCAAMDTALRRYDDTSCRFSSPISICSNLPYNVGTELLVRWLHYPDKIKSMTLMFQREVAERIVARVGGRQYGRLSVLAALGWKAKILFNVPNTAFVPPPKVQSSVVQLIPTGEKYQIEKIEKLTAVLFGQRRKMIRGILPDIDWARFGLKGSERAEELSPEMFLRISKKIHFT